jgi:hypothetical protein
MRQRIYPIQLSTWFPPDDPIAVVVARLCILREDCYLELQGFVAEPIQERGHKPSNSFARMDDNSYHWRRLYFFRNYLRTLNEIRNTVSRAFADPVIVQALDQLASHWMQPPDRATLNWVQLLWSGKKLSVDIGDLPEHAKGSLLVEGQSYIAWYQQDPCLWQSTGPVQLPMSMGAEVVENHYSKAGVSIGRDAHLNRTESATATSECHSPRERKMVVHGLPVDIDRRGYLTFGGTQHRIGALRIPGWAWPWSK